MNTFSIDENLKKGLGGGCFWSRILENKKKSKSRFTEITTKIEDWKLKFVIFENFTNHGESIRHKSRVTRIKKIRRQRKLGLPQSQIMKKNGEREKKMHAWQ